MSTLRERFAAALEARDERLVKTTSRYCVFSRQAGGHYYLGSAGALRFGPTVTASIPVSNKFKNLLLGIPQQPTAGE